jgi:hypothetical protein
MKLIFSLMTPGAWLALLAALLLSVGAGGAVGYQVASGLAEIRELKVQGEIQSWKLAYAAAQAHETEKVNRLTEARLKDVAEVASKHKEEMDDAKNTIDALRADVRNGAVRLSIATRPPARPSGSAASGNPSPADGAGAETRSELSPEASEFLIDFAGRCDANTRQLNSVIDAYNSIRQPVSSGAATVEMSTLQVESSRD